MVALPVAIALAVMAWHGVLTLLYGAQFVGQDHQTHMVGGAEHLRVLRYGGDAATVYYYDWDGGTILTFERAGDGWVMNWWDAVWSSTGSADKFIFPYLWHSAEGGAVLIGCSILLFLMCLLVWFTFWLVEWVRGRRARRRGPRAEK